MSRPARFAFVVHALTPLHRRLMGVAMGRPGLALGLRSGVDPSQTGRICRFELEGVAEGWVVGVPLLPAQMLMDQNRAVDRVVSSVSCVEEWDQQELEAVGLGSLFGVVGARGEAVAERLSMPVTNGGAATAWALSQNTLATVAQVGVNRVAIVGSNSPVGRVTTQLMEQAGLTVRVDGSKAPKGTQAKACGTPEQTVRGCSVVVGAGTTGGILDAAALDPNSVLVDVAIPGTLKGPPADGVVVLAGEAVAFPPGWRRGGWGYLYHLLAGYGPSQLFACLIEPLLLAVSKRNEPFSLGRRTSVESVQELGEMADQLGFRSRLATGWREISLVDRPQITAT